MSSKPRTHEQFIEKLKLKNPMILKKFKIISFYTKAHDKILLKGKYGLVQVTPSKLVGLNSSPTITSAVNQTDYFINQAKEIHGDEYNYSKTIYAKSNKKIIITCKKHGDFLQSPHSHLKGHGCPSCGEERRINSVAITFKNFIKKSNLVHNNKYNYDKVVYNVIKDKAIITCPIHGDFVQKVESHMNGVGCPKCNSMHFHLKSILKHSSDYKANECELYIIEMFNNNEKFYKIGITTRGVSTRFKILKFYKYNVISTIKDTTYNIKFLENYIHEKLSKYSYIPEYKFDGHTECFSKIDDNIIEFCYADLDNRINKFIKEEAITNEID